MSHFKRPSNIGSHLNSASNKHYPVVNKERNRRYRRNYLGAANEQLWNYWYFHWKRSNNWTETSKILSAYKCASYIWCQKIIFSESEYLLQLKQKYYDVTWIRIWRCSRSTRWGKSATGCKKLLDVKWQKISPRFIWVMKEDIMNQVRKQSLTQVCFHLENNHAQQLLRKTTQSLSFSGYNQIGNYSNKHVMLEKEHVIWKM